MQIFLILALIVALLAVIFAVQNVALVSITFFAWKIDISLAVALLVALGAGVLITLLLSIPGKVKGSWNSASNKKKYSKLEAERDSLKLKIDEISSDRDKYLKKLEDSEKEIATLEEQMASISAALQEEIDKSDAKMPPAITPAEVNLSEKATNEAAGENPLEADTSEVGPS